MHRRVALVAAIAAIGVAGGALPSSAAAADVQWRCAATPLSGTLLGQKLPDTGVGSLTGECATLTLGRALELPSLLKLEALNGVTAVNEQGAFAAAGLARVTVGKLPIPIPEIPIPDALKKIEVALPGTSLPIATVDLTPAIEAIQTLPSKNLLDLGLLSSNVTGTCKAGKPVITGASMVLNGSILGLPIDMSGTVDSAVNLINTESIDLSSLDTSLARVTLLGGVLNVDTGTILGLLDPILDSLPPISIPPQLARVKLTGPTQSRVDGNLIQRALRAEISLLGQSIADLSIGTASVGEGIACAPEPEPEPVALDCTKRKLTLIDVLPQGDHVRLYGEADKSLVGETVRIIFQATGETVARVKVRRDGRFTTTAPMPALNVRFTNRARYIARAGGEKSLNLKLMRRMVVESVRSRNGIVRIVGRVVPPLADEPQTITLKRRVTCRKLEVVKRFKPNRDGSFVVTAKSPKNLAATAYRLETFVRESLTNPKLYPTYTLPRGVDF